MLGIKTGRQPQLDKLVICLTQVTLHLVVAATTPSGVLDEIFIWNRWHLDGLLGQSVKKFAPVSQAAAIESKCELVEVIVEVGGADGPLMGAQQPALEQRHDKMHTWQELVRRLGMVADKRDAVPVAVRLDAVVADPAVGVDLAPGLDHVVDESLEAVG